VIVIEPLKFSKRCDLGLAAIGVMGFVWRERLS
jgi:hypothetical protein